MLFGRLALLLPRMLAGLVSAPEALVEVVEVAATLPEALGAETLKATVSEAMVLEPGASEAVV